MKNNTKGDRRSASAAGSPPRTLAVSCCVSISRVRADGRNFFHCSCTCVSFSFSLLLFLSHHLAQNLSSAASLSPCRFLPSPSTSPSLSLSVSSPPLLSSSLSALHLLSPFFSLPFLSLLMNCRSVSISLARADGRLLWILLFSLG